MKKNAFFVVITALSLFLAYRIFFPVPVSGTEHEEKKSVRTIGVSPTPFQETALFSGFIRGVKQADITPTISGSIIRLLKEEGDRVYQGEVLAVLDGRTLLALQKSSLMSLESTNTQLKETRKYYDQKVDEAKTALDNASGSSEHDAASEAVKSAKRLRDAELASLETQKAAREGSMLVSQANLSDTVIRAPFDGVVMRKNTSLGSFVSPSAPIYSIATQDAFEIVVSLPQNIADHITKRSTVSVSDGTTSVAGQIFSLVSGADESSQQSIARIRFAPSAAAPQAFHLGEHVEVSFLVGAPRDALFVPESALISKYDDTFVYIVENGSVKRYPVILGTVSGDNREIISGISSGVHVVIEGEHTLSDNQSVEEIYVAQ